MLMKIDDLLIYRTEKLIKMADDLKKKYSFRADVLRETDVAIIMRDHWYCYDIMIILSTLFILALTSQRGNVPLAIDTFFNPVRRIGADSANGRAYRGRLIYKNAMLVIKEPISPMSLHGAAYEAAIGLYLNKLRKDIPNFMFTYGSFTCGASEPTMQYKEYRLCSNDRKGKPLYTALEFIDGDTLENLMQRRTLNAQQIGNIYFQVILALAYAQHKFNFTHYDLHTNNVMVRELRMLQTFYYPLDNSTGYYVTTKYIPVIIDFGYSHISVPIESGGKVKMMSVQDPEASDILKYTGYNPGYDNLYFSCAYNLSVQRYYSPVGAEAMVTREIVDFLGGSDMFRTVKSFNQAVLKRQDDLNAITEVEKNEFKRVLGVDYMSSVKRHFYNNACRPFGSSGMKIKSKNLVERFDRTHPAKLASYGISKINNGIYPNRTCIPLNVALEKMNIPKLT